MNKTIKPKNEQWFLINAKGQRLGRIASTAAEDLLGKHEATTKDYLMPDVKVVITNAANIDVTTRKLAGKIYTRYSGYPGGLTVRTMGEMMSKYPERVIEKAIKGMLPKNSLGRQMFKKLHVYAGAEHNNQAQKPENYELRG